MNIKKIYLTRHGQTDFNRKGIVQGSGVDSDLNVLGKTQADAFYQRFKAFAWDKLYLSDLKRTHQSMEGFIADGLLYEKLPELNEISWGIHEGVPVSEENNVHYQNMLRRWRCGETHIAVDSGESPDEVAVRMKSALDYILSKHEEKRVLICMHGRAMRVMLTVMLNYPLCAMDLFEHHNLCLYEFTYTGSMFILDRYNDVSHLAPL